MMKNRKFLEFNTLTTKCDYEKILNKYLFGFYKISFKFEECFYIVTIKNTAPIINFFRYKKLKKFIDDNKVVGTNIIYK